jgi:hypothetical protein
MQKSNQARHQTLAQPLDLGNNAVVRADNDQLAEHISMVVRVGDIAPLGPLEQFRHRSIYRIAGVMVLTAATATPTRLWVDESSDCAVLPPRVQRHVSAGHGLSPENQPGQWADLQPLPRVVARYRCEASDGTLHLDDALHRPHRPMAVDLENPSIEQVLVGLRVLFGVIDSMGAVKQPDSPPLVRLQEGSTPSPRPC